MLDSAGRLEYVIQAAECGWDSELASSNWDPVSGRGELGEAGPGLEHWAGLGGGIFCKTLATIKYIYEFYALCI